MDAVKFIQERVRLCKAYGSCTDCPFRNNRPCLVGANSSFDANEHVKIVEEWSATHSRKTRQSVFWEQWPNAARDRDGVVNVCPKLVDVDISCTDDETERTGLCKACDDCRREFWMQEVE